MILGIKAGLVAGLMMVLGVQAHATESKRYLVKFKSDQTFQNVVKNVAQARRSNVAGGVKLFSANAAVTESFNNLGMIVVETSDAQAIASLRKHPAIAVVEEEIFHPAPKPVATFGRSVMNVRPMSRKSLETPWGITAVKAPGAWNTTRGAGARVLVLDTGLDINHEAVLSRFEKGRNFTGGSATDLTDAVGHGTHVSGTVLADGADGGLIGVAPEARLLMGKVCGLRGCSSVAIAGGLNWAVQERVDVVNMSLGGMFMSEMEAQALIAAESAGVFVAAASGNDGKPYVSFPAAAATPLAVGAVDSTLVKADFSQWGPELDVVAPGVDTVSSVPVGTGREAVTGMELENKGMSAVASLPMQGSPISSNLESEAVFAGLGKAEDFALINVAGKIALISRGEITFADKVKNAIQGGAVGVIIFNNEAGLLSGSLSEDGTEVAVPVVMIEQSTGESAKAILVAGGPVRASISVNPTDYASLQGTSMATPHVAGVAALVRASNPQLTPAQVRDVLKRTATALGPNTANEYGSGLVNAEAAVAEAVAMRVPEFLRTAN